jgi:hypothetical protein
MAVSHDALCGNTLPHMALFLGLFVIELSFPFRFLKIGFLKNDRRTA